MIHEKANLEIWICNFHHLL